MQCGYLNLNADVLQRRCYAAFCFQWSRVAFPSVIFLEKMTCCAYAPVFSFYMGSNTIKTCFINALRE